MVNNYNKSSTISLDTYNRRKQLKRRELRSHGGGFGNVLEACYQETAIRKRRFRIAGSHDPSSLRIYIYSKSVRKSNYGFLF